MPRKRSNKGIRPLKEVNQPANTLQANKITSHETSKLDLNMRSKSGCDSSSELIVGIKSIMDDENCQPSTSTLTVDNLSTNTAALYNELDSFRLRWKRELQETKKPEICCNRIITDRIERLNIVGDNQGVGKSFVRNETSSSKESTRLAKIDSSDQIYAKAKKLFLLAVELERDEMHHESIRYYKQAMHLYPDIEKQIFREQCEASARSSAKIVDNSKQPTKASNEISPRETATPDNCEIVDLYERIRQKHYEDNKTESCTHCRPAQKPKPGSLHISDLPHELLMQIYRYVIGKELDLASLESIGMVCRGFYLLSKDPSLWRSICYSTWGSETLTSMSQSNEHNNENKERQPVTPLNWRQMFLNRPRVNYDGVYISRTRYIRQGDVGFQDITYRPFHVIRYYRYLRFFPDRRVLILTTNEEPDKIVPIFRHALHSKQFSSELSILEGVFEFVNENQISIVAEKDCTIRSLTHNSKRPAPVQWSRQTPITQKFSLKFELKTAENKPYKNNLLKWLDYTILERFEVGQEITPFDVTPDTFPNLIFSRVKRFNLKLTNPLSSH